jgi:hypothetical protein
MVKETPIPEKLPLRSLAAASASYALMYTE